MPSHLHDKKIRERRAKVKKNANKKLSSSAWMYSVGGKLYNIFEEIPSGLPEHSQKYNPIQLGEPLVIRYKNFFIKNNDSANKEEEIMLSTFLSSSETSTPAAETVNFYDPNMEFNSEGEAYFDPAQSDNYGNQLIYYTKSYVGEPILMTTSLMELDNQAYTDQLSSALGTASQIPFFVEFLPHIVAAQKLTEWLGKLWNFLDKDDEILGRMRLNLYHDRDFSEKLRHGRYICVKDIQESDLKNYRLTNDNILVDQNNELYKASSYFITQIDSKYHEEYESFQNAQESAELLSLTNRKNGSDLEGFLSISMAAAEAYSDVETLNKMEKIQNRLGQSGMLDKYKAHYNNLSADSQERYSSQFNEKITKFN